MKLASTAADLKTETEGNWVDIPEWPGVRLRVRGVGYPAFQTALKLVRGRLFRKYPGKKPVPQEEEDIANGRLYAEHLLLEWDGFEDAPYSPEAALEALMNPAHRQLRAQVAWAAGQVGQAPIDGDEDSPLGNLKGGSDGNSGGAAKQPGSSA